MILLLIIADDFTGALDTGVQFAARGARTEVVVDPQIDFSACGADVLVVDTETRHLPAADAYKAVFDLVERARRAGVRFIYKKTDSALRGNIGAELSALLEASGLRQLPFLPAYPKTGRITKNGVHYINGVPVTESPFGKDPFEPVRHSVIAELIGEQCPAPAVSVPVLSDASPLPDQEGILIFDAETDEELSRAGRRLYQAGRLSIMAGCAGFGAVLPELLKLAKSERQPLPKLDPRLLVVCGSVNPITLAQLDHAEKNGFSRLRLTPEQKLEPGYWQSQEGKEAILKIQDMLAANDRCIIESNDAGGNSPTAEYAKELGIDLETLRVRIAGSLGYLVGQIFTCPSLGTLLLTGGDTLLQCMNCLGVHRLEPVCELEKGVVLASFTYQGCTRHVITKSGGFGTEGLFTGLSKQIIDMEGKP